MDAPDKIYVNIPGDYWHPGIESEKVDTDTEYIRKDALMEWLKMKTESAEIVVANSVAMWVTRQVYNQVMDKLNSM